MDIMHLDKTLEATQTLRWLYVDFNSYFASVEQQLKPHLRGRPVAVVPVETDATCAIAASYEAKAYGIKTGTPIYEAKRMCPNLVCVLADHQHYLEFHHRIIEEVDRHIPVEVVASIDEVASRLMKNETSVERVTEIARSIKAGLAQNIGEYVRCSIGVAPNRYLAKVATDLHKPDGFTILHGQDLPGRLLSLSLRDLPGIGHNMEVRLRKSGIFSVEQLWGMNAKQMRKAWGSVWGEKMWYYLRGVELPDEETTRSTIGHSHVLAPELRPPGQAKLVARRLTLKVTSRLRRMEHYASEFHLSIRLENGPRLGIAAQIYRAQDSVTFTHLLDELWKELMKESRNALIKKISVSLYKLEPANGLQDELFTGLSADEMKARARGERMSHALDKLNHRYGRDTVLLGLMPEQGRSFTGTKIAFTRIPDAEEFLE